jgi:hypothetical protein
MLGNADFQSKRIKRTKSSLNIGKGTSSCIRFENESFASNFIIQTLMHIKRQKASATIRVGEFKTTLSPIDRSSRQ